MATQIKTCMIGSLKTWKDINGALPERIIYYRDGVGEGTSYFCCFAFVVSFSTQFVTVNWSSLFGFFMLTFS